jgi:TolA-binding protein
MKRLLDETEPSFGALTELLESAAPCELSPFSKPAIKTRLARALEGAAGRGRWRASRPLLLGVAGLLFAATAAAAGYSLLEPTKPVASVTAAPAPLVAQPTAPATPPPTANEAAPSPVDEAPSEAAPAPSAKRAVSAPRAGEDPTQVAEAVRALRKQGDYARAQALLDRYLKSNPRGALAEDALALSIEAAAARKDPRAADYARRYLARYPSGRFRAVAERALAR